MQHPTGHRCTWPEAVCFAALALLAAPASAALVVDLTTSNANPVNGGPAFTYSIVLTNPDAGAASNVVLTDALPGQILLLNHSISGPQAGSLSCVTPPVGETGTVVCRAVSFPAGGSATVSLVVQGNPALSGGVRTNTVRVVSGGVAVTDSVQVTAVNNASLALGMSGQSSASRGSTVAFRVQLNNGGNSGSLNTALTNPVPTGARFVSAFGSGAFADTCSVQPLPTLAVVCADMDVPSGIHFLTLVFEVAPDFAGSTLTNTATLTSGVGSVSGSPASASTTITN